MSATGPSRNQIHTNLVAAREELQDLASKSTADKAQALKSVNKVVNQAFTDLESQHSLSNEKAVREVWTDIRDLMMEVYKQQANRGKSKTLEQLEKNICKLSGHIIFKSLDILSPHLVAKLLIGAGREPASKRREAERGDTLFNESVLDEINAMSPKQRRLHQVDTVRDLVMQARLRFIGLNKSSRNAKEEITNLCNEYLDLAERKLSERPEGPAKRAALQEVENFKTDLERSRLPSGWKTLVQELQERLSSIEANLKGEKKPPYTSESD